MVSIGGLAQLARALAWHARGHRFDPDILHLSGITHFIVCIISAEIFDILTHETVESKLKNRDTGMYIIIYVLDVRAESMRFDCD